MSSSASNGHRGQCVRLAACVVALLLWMGLIFFMSANDGDHSQGMSDGVTSVAPSTPPARRLMSRQLLWNRSASPCERRGISASTPCWVCSPSRHFARVRCFGLPGRFGSRGRSPLRRRARWLSPLCTPASMSSTSCSLRVEVGSRSMSVLIPQARLWQSPSRWLWCACGKGAAFSAVLVRLRHRCDMLLSVHFSNCCFPKARIS